MVIWVRMALVCLGLVNALWISSMLVPNWHSYHCTVLPTNRAHILHCLADVIQEETTVKAIFLEVDRDGASGKAFELKYKEWTTQNVLGLPVLFITYDPGKGEVEFLGYRWVDQKGERVYSPICSAIEGFAAVDGPIPVDILRLVVRHAAQAIQRSVNVDRVTERVLSRANYHLTHLWETCYFRWVPWLRIRETAILSWALALILMVDLLPFWLAVRSIKREGMLHDWRLPPPAWGVLLRSDNPGAVARRYQQGLAAELRKDEAERQQEATQRARQFAELELERQRAQREDEVAQAERDRLAKLHQELDGILAELREVLIDTLTEEIRPTFIERRDRCFTMAERKKIQNAITYGREALDLLGYRSGRKRKG